MKTIRCADCNIVFCLLDDIYKRRVEDGEVFFCPGGHKNVFRPSENETLKVRVGRLEKLVSNQKSEISYLRNRLEKLEADLRLYQGRASGYKGQWMLLKKRIERGEVVIN